MSDYKGREFYNWLLNYKKFKEKSSRDIISRLKRIDRDVGIPNGFDRQFISSLDDNEKFSNYNLYIKTHIKAYNLIQAK